MIFSSNFSILKIASECIYKKRISRDLHKIIPDRIEAGTYIIAGAITKSNIVIKSIISTYLTNVIETIKKIGIEINVYSDKIYVFGKDSLILSPIKVETDVYPGFPTDLQPLLTTLLTQINGLSIIEENIWKNRFHHVKQLKKMGAKISINQNIATIRGHTPLKGTSIIVLILEEVRHY